MFSDDRKTCDTNSDCGTGASCDETLCECPDGTCGHGGHVCHQKCVCKIKGDPEVITYDAMEIVMGVPTNGFKTYTLTKNVFNTSDPCSFDVQVSLGPFDNHRMAYLSTLPQNMSISILGERITLLPNNEAYDGDEKIDLDSGPYVRDEFKVELATEEGTQYLRFRSDKCDITIGFFRRGYRAEGSVELPCKYAGDGRLTGLCGTCDGKLNDLRTAEGVDVSHVGSRFKDIAKSYEVDNF